MKLASVLALALGLTLASHAQAEIKPYGTYVPEVCSKTDNNRGGISAAIVAAIELCFARIVGYNGPEHQYVGLKLNNGETRVYRVTAREELPTTSDRQIVAYQLELTFEGILGRRNLVQRIGLYELPWLARAEYSFQGQPLKVVGKTAGNVKVSAREFQYMATTRGGGL